MCVFLLEPASFPSYGANSTQTRSPCCPSIEVALLSLAFSSFENKRPSIPSLVFETLLLCQSKPLWPQIFSFCFGLGAAIVSRGIAWEEIHGDAYVGRQELLLIFLGV